MVHDRNGIFFCFLFFVFGGGGGFKSRFDSDYKTENKDINGCIRDFNMTN